MGSDRLHDRTARLRRQAEREELREELAASDSDLAALIEQAAPIVDRLIARGKGNEALEALGLRARWLRSMKEAGAERERKPAHRKSEYWGIRQDIFLPRITPRHPGALRALGDVVAVLLDYLEHASRIHTQLNPEQREQLGPELVRFIAAGRGYLGTAEEVLRSREEQEARAAEIRSQREQRKQGRRA